MKVIKNIFGLGALILAIKPKGVGITENNATSKPIESTDAPFLKKMDYRKGDEAKTLAEYADAVKEEFDCEGNEIAKNMSHLWGSVLMVYGETHTNELLPGIRGSRGAIYLENEDSRKCKMTKYTENPDHMCVHIEKPDDNVNKIFEEVIKLSKEMIELIEPGRVGKIHAEATPEEIETWKGGITPYVMKLDEFIKREAEQAFNRATPEKKYALLQMRKFRSSAIQKLNSNTNESRDSRDEKMFLESAKIISKLGEGAAGTYVVGDNHVPGIVKRLKKKFPERPIVTCRPKSKIKM